jgi:uncharacterized protein
MSGQLDKIEQQLGGRRNYDAPPLHLWNPQYSGDIDIRIDRSGQWFHDGDPILREAIVRIFASILRREEDGHYYLVTPVEKWRIQVEQHPLSVIDVYQEEGGSRLLARLNTEKSIVIDAGHSLYLDPDAGDVAVLQLDHQLTALFSRAAWYRLVEEFGNDGQLIVTSGDYRVDLLAG